MRLYKSKLLGLALLFCLIITLMTTVSAATPVWSGGPYTFNGSNPVTTSSAIGISGNSAWSIAAWVYSFTGGPNNGYGWGIAGWGNAATNQGNFLYYNDAEKTFEYGFYGNDAQTAASYNPNTWYHITDTWDGTTQKIYVNGTLITSRAPGSRSLTNTTAKIGTDPFGQARNFKGGMERVQIYNVALTQAEVTALAATAPTWTPSGPTPTPTPVPGTPTPTPTVGPTPPPGTTAFLQRIEPAPGTKINSTFWNARVKNCIINWIPYCYTQLSNVNLAEGGIDNFVQAGNKLKGLSYKAHVGYWFSNAYVHNTVEAMCNACMIDPQGDSAIISAQNAMKTKLEDWIPKILSAQESDGYLHTWTTLGNNARWTDRSAHEGYTGGYFIESAIAHYMMTNKTDTRLYSAAKKLADCWYNNVGPGKKVWWDGHEEMEQALGRLGAFVNANEGAGLGDKYLQLAKALMDGRYSNSSGQYDQSHAYPINQTTAVGHAVRAMYLYSGMTEVGMQLNNSSYLNAVNKIWDNFVNRKLYVTGGVGSGETSEGFGNDYSLPNSAYAESCANCGMLMFMSKMNYMYADGKYADLMELPLYNGILGSLDLNALNFTYTNPLDSSAARYKWHTCPCCVGNIPKTTLALPRWMYAKGGDNNSIYVNMYIGSTFTINGVAGTNVQMVQATDYPINGNVTITVNPSTAKSFTIYLHSPDRSVSTLYSSTPDSNGISSITVNGSAVSTSATKGYVAINRTWNPGDTINIVLPMQIQRVKAVSNVAADVGRVALMYGPLVYNIESVDQNVDLILSPSAALTVQWNASLLGGVNTIKGTFTSGAAMTAIPNYARLNRGGRSLVWLRDQ